ncbi:hypothetical protein JW916_06020 [Candidatus Sumerlaeota bacterium]|nr:hypothetical protein [Candidatus Sumerlaeota bacterium]
MGRHPLAGRSTGRIPFWVLPLLLYAPSSGFASPTLDDKISATKAMFMWACVGLVGLVVALSFVCGLVSNRGRFPGNAWLFGCVGLALAGIGAWKTKEDSWAMFPRPNYRRTVSSDLRSLATALEGYYVENRTSPPMVSLRSYGGDGKSLQKAGGQALHAIDPGVPGTAGRLDPFSPGKEVSL